MAASVTLWSVLWVSLEQEPCYLGSMLRPLPAPPNYPLRYPIYQLIESIRPLIEVHRGV